MFNKILYTIVIAIFIFLSVALFLPSKVTVERSIRIDSPASTVFVLVNSFQSFEAWSPLAFRDPTAEYRFSGPSSGVGARMEWKGDPRQVGNGWQEIVESVPYQRVSMQLDFENQGRAISRFEIEPSQSGTQITRKFETNLVEGQGFFGSLLARYFGLFFDQWIGTDYEQGLANLKAHAESLPATDFSGLEVEILQVEPVRILYVPTSNQPMTAGVSDTLAEAYLEIDAFMQEHSIERLSQPMAITRSRDAHYFELDAAVPVSAVDAVLSGNLMAGFSPSGTAVRAVHRGAYEDMGPTYEKLSAFMAVNGLEEGRVSWEHYISDPERVPVPERVTHIYFLIGEETTEQP